MDVGAADPTVRNPDLDIRFCPGFGGECCVEEWAFGVMRDPSSEGFFGHFVVAES